MNYKLFLYSNFFYLFNNILTYPIEVYVTKLQLNKPISKKVDMVGLPYEISKSFLKHNLNFFTPPNPQGALLSSTAYELMNYPLNSKHIACISGKQNKLSVKGVQVHVFYKAILTFFNYFSLLMCNRMIDNVIISNFLGTCIYLISFPLYTKYVRSMDKVDNKYANTQVIEKCQEACSDKKPKTILQRHPSLVFVVLFKLVLTNLIYSFVQRLKIS